MLVAASSPAESEQSRVVSRTPITALGPVVASLTTPVRWNSLSVDDVAQVPFTLAVLISADVLIVRLGIVLSLRIVRP